LIFLITLLIDILRLLVEYKKAGKMKSCNVFHPVSLFLELGTSFLLYWLLMHFTGMILLVIFVAMLKITVSLVLTKDEMVQYLEEKSESFAKLGIK